MNRGTRTFWLLVAVLLGSSTYFGVQAERRRRVVQRGGEAAVAPGGAVTVARVLDGDSLLLQTPGGTVPVRIVGIKAFSTLNDKDPAAPFGEAARAELSRLLTREPLLLQTDEKDRDRFGRTLATVFAGGEDVALALLGRGLVIVHREHPFPRMPDYLNAEEEARKDSRGLWAVPEVAHRAEQLALRRREEAR